MKKLNKLKLSNLSKKEIEKEEMRSLKGGFCTCTCAYQGGQGDPCSMNDNCGASGDDYYGGASDLRNGLENRGD